jgi:hypothetical protein
LVNLSKLTINLVGQFAPRCIWARGGAGGANISGAVFVVVDYEVEFAGNPFFVVGRGFGFALGVCQGIK